MKKFRQLLLVKFFLVALLISCKSDPANENGLIVHPLEENIPHFDREHENIGTTLLTNENVLPKKFQSLKNYLNHPEEFERTPLDIMVSGADTDVSSVNEEQIVILDKGSDRLILHDMNAKTSTTIANQGRGPGDIAYVQEMIVVDSSIYVAMEDMRISEFGCNGQTCEYKQTIPLDFSVVSVAKSNNNFAVLGQTVLSENSGGEIDRKAVRIVDIEGSPQSSFGSFYTTDHWIVLFSIRDGFIRYSNGLKKYVLAYRGLPLLYVFDDDLNLSTTYEFEEYLQGEIVFNPILNAASPPTNNMTIINRVEIVDDKFLYVNNRTVYEDESSGIERNYRNDYYAIDLSNHQSYFLGSTTGEEDSAIYPLAESIIQSNNGELFYVEM